MKIRLERAWGHWSKGHVFTDMPGGQARTLIARHIASEIKDEPADAQRDYASPLNRMMRPQRRK